MPFLTILPLSQSDSRPSLSIHFDYLSGLAGRCSVKCEPGSIESVAELMHTMLNGH